MKRSERLIRNTILALAGLVVLHVGVSRLYADSNPALVAQRTSAADLAKLRGFNAIEVNGDFSVDVVQGADYSVISLRVDKASMNAGKVDLAGRVTLTVID